MSLFDTGNKYVMLDNKSTHYICQSKEIEGLKFAEYTAPAICYNNLNSKSCKTNTRTDIYKAMNYLTEKEVIYFWFSDKYFDRKAIMASFINSEG